MPYTDWNTPLLHMQGYSSSTKDLPINSSAKLPVKGRYRSCTSSMDDIVSDGIRIVNSLLKTGLKVLELINKRIY